MTPAGIATPPRASSAMHWFAWPALGALCALTGVAFYLWGVHGPSYLVDLIAAYCF